MGFTALFEETKELKTIIVQSLVNIGGGLVGIPIENSQKTPKTRKGIKSE